MHQNDFSVIKSDENSKPVHLHSQGLFKSYKYENEIKIKLRQLPQDNNEFIKVLIWVETAFDKKMQFLKQGAVGDLETIETEIKNIYSKVDKMQL